MAANYLIPQGLHECIRKLHKRKCSPSHRSPADPAGNPPRALERPAPDPHIALSTQPAYNFYPNFRPNTVARSAKRPSRRPMSLLTIPEYPDPRFRNLAQPIAVSDAALQTRVGVFEDRE